MLVGCGYRPLYATSAQRQLTVQVGQVLVPETLAVQAAASGARDELAAGGRLRHGTEFPRLVIDVLRVDESSRGVRILAGQPRASGMSVAVTVRGRVFLADAQEASLDTGDIRRAVQLAGDADARVDSAAYDQALRAAAERAGAAVGRAVSGIPEPADETP